MKKNLQSYFSLLLLLCIIQLPSNLNAQINYTANFNSGIDGWSSPGFDFSQFTGASACNTGAVRANLYGSNPDGILLSPSLGTSTGSTILFTYSYKVADWSANTSGTTNPWGNFTVEYASSATGPWTTVPGSLVNQTNHIVSGSCATKSVTFVAPAGAVFVRFNCFRVAGDFYLNFDEISAVEIPAPPTPTQDLAIPTCASGSTIDVVGTPPANTTWYWQSSSTGISTSIPYAGPYTINANGTYYLRALNTLNNVWSVASSVTVTNFPTAALPAAPIAGANPACVTTGTTLTATTPPSGTTYYWQTVVNGSSFANNATTPLPVSTTGTYYLAAYETATQCWSNTVSTSVTVDTYVPATPSAATTNYNICAGTASQLLTATGGNVPAPSALTIPLGSSMVSSGDAPAVYTTAIPSLPAGAVITSAQLNLVNAEAINGSYRSEIRVALGDMFTLAATQISTVASSGLITPNPVINLTGFPTTGGNLNLIFTETVNDGAAGVNDATIGSATLTINYTIPGTIEWYTAPTAGTLLGSNSPFESIGTSVLPTASTSGTYNFYATTIYGGCQSTTRLPITVNVTTVLADLPPVNVTCNGGDNGSFTLGAVTCGTQPFEYSVNGSPYSPVIPTDLIAGTYTVTIQDANLFVSAPITVVITEPAAPSALTANNVTYYNAELSWTTTGDETSWTVIYGPTGFDPATQGTVLTGQTNPAFLTGVLTADTDYQFYVFSECGPNPDTSAVFAFSTDPGFLASDNACGPGFIDISSTGTLVDFSSDPELFLDEAEALVTAPYAITFNNVTSANVTVGMNGGVVLGGTATTEITTLMPATVGAGQIGFYPFNEDLDVPFDGIYTQTLGTAPNRQFVVMWSDAPVYLGDDGFTFEIVFDEATSEVYYLYQDKNSTDFGENLGGNAEIGIRTAIASQFVNTSLNNTAYLTANSCAHYYNALCPNVTNFTANVQADDAILDWNPGLYGESAWTLVYGLAGFDPANPAEVINTFNLNSSDASFGNSLTQLTGYDVYIYSECAADNLTSNGFFYNFTTLPFCSNPSGITAATDVDSLEAAWNWVEVAGYPISSFNIQYGPTGFNLYEGTEVVANGTNLADTVFDSDFMGGGVYQVYVQAVCDDLVNGGTDTSSFIGPITFVMPLTTDLVCGAEMLDVDGTVYTFNNTGATVSLNESNIAPPATGAQTIDGWANSTLNNTTWYKFIAPASGSVRINATANNYNGQIAVYDVANCADFNTNFDLMGANDNEINGVSLAPNFTVCGLTPGNEYYLMHDGFNATTGVHKIAITEIVLQAGLANPVTNICTEATLDLFTTINGYDNGGVWSAPVAAVNASITNSTFDSEGLAYTTFTFQYRVTDGCAYDSITSQVTVFAPSSAGEDGTLNVCKNEMVDLLSGLTGTVQTGGTWYDPSNVAIGSSLITSANFPGQYNYDYIAGNGVCPNDTANVVVIVSSTCDINSIDESVFAGVSVYPNPSTGIIFVDADLTAGNFDYVVTDANGRVIASATNGIKAASTSTIDLSNVETGVYFIRLSNSSADKMFRIVVQ